MLAVRGMEATPHVEIHGNHICLGGTLEVSTHIHSHFGVAHEPIPKLTGPFDAEKRENPTKKRADLCIPPN